ncbi:low-molecular-weight cysteine-rich 69 [Hibiscus trionum]|uniref:Low-molecular-weight cysteine-rich 69 n=1 Tax=Hibiscus trionum TaxID=183268 RepID=A0A9W7I2U8_HIBTR|nr:low-molecular-weight cysteine-rich 69 [Hibiscus trionum]GMI87563.1 low-molecular-weight cysteine-rich 69 [Hibiscus trionum]
MERSLSLFPACCVIILLLAAEMGPMMADARECKSPSGDFQGICLSNDVCATICKLEGFSSGGCEGVFDRECICYKDCF